jgi:hypothetical protein
MLPTHRYQCLNLMYSAGAAFSAHLTGMAEEILEAVSFSKAALKRREMK